MAQHHTLSLVVAPTGAAPYVKSCGGTYWPSTTKLRLLVAMNAERKLTVSIKSLDVKFNLRLSDVVLDCVTRKTEDLVVLDVVMVSTRGRGRRHRFGLHWTFELV